MVNIDLGGRGGGYADHLGDNISLRGVPPRGPKRKRIKSDAKFFPSTVRAKHVMHPMRDLKHAIKLACAFAYQTHIVTLGWRMSNQTLVILNVRTLQSRHAVTTQSPHSHHTVTTQSPHSHHMENVG